MSSLAIPDTYSLHAPIQYPSKVMGSRGAQAPSSNNYLKERIGQRDGLMIREKLPNFLLVYTSKKGNPTSHYWPKKSEQDAVRGDFFGDEYLLTV